MDAKITVYGVDDCEDTQRARQFLDSHHAAYEYVDLNQDKEAEQMVEEANDGKRRTPLVVVEFGTEARKLREPSNDELADALRDIKAVDEAA